MKQHSDPIEFLIDFAWASGADRFVVNNAKDELKKLRNKQELSKEMAIEAFIANQFAVEETNKYLKQANELENLKQSLDYPVAFAKINDRGDLYDLRLTDNPYDSPEKVIPLYRMK